jgi:hypothetical protein
MVVLCASLESLEDAYLAYDTFQRCRHALQRAVLFLHSSQRMREKRYFIPIYQGWKGKIRADMHSVHHNHWHAPYGKRFRLTMSGKEDLQVIRVY